MANTASNQPNPMQPPPGPTDLLPRRGDFALFGQQVVEIIEYDPVFVSVRFPGQNGQVSLIASELSFPASLRQT